MSYEKQLEKFSLETTSKPQSFVSYMSEMWAGPGHIRLRRPASKRSYLKDTQKIRRDFLIAQCELELSSEKFQDAKTLKKEIIYKALLQLFAMRKIHQKQEELDSTCPKMMKRSKKRHH